MECTFLHAFSKKSWKKITLLCKLWFFGFTVNEWVKVQIQTQYKNVQGFVSVVATTADWGKKKLVEMVGGGRMSNSLCNFNFQLLKFVCTNKNYEKFHILNSLRSIFGLDSRVKNFFNKDWNADKHINISLIQNLQLVGLFFAQMIPFKNAATIYLTLNRLVSPKLKHFLKRNRNSHLCIIHYFFNVGLLKCNFK